MLSPQTPSIDAFIDFLRKDIPAGPAGPAVVEVPEDQDNPDLTEAQFNQALMAPENQFDHPLSKVRDLDELARNLADKWWRLNNLYYIIDKKGRKVLFHLNRAQRWLYNGMWYMNLILKSRQHGFTTFIAIFILDECLFNDNKEGGIIAHNLDDAKKIFRRKIKYPYDNLPDFIKRNRTLKTDSASEMFFRENNCFCDG